MVSLFYMWSKRRGDLIAQHEFYVSEGKSRLIDQLSNINQLEAEAEKKGEQWFNERSQRFDPDRDDEADIYEGANDIKIIHFQALDQLGNDFRLALIAGMFHQWERSLKDWMTSNDGILFWHKSEALHRAIWKANFHQVFELFECAGLFSAGDKVKGTLNKCRLVVNTYKHGRGSSLDELKQMYPELLDRYQLGKDHEWFSAEYRSYEDLYISPTMIDEFSNAIVEFWKIIPEYLTEDDFTELPTWLSNAIKKT